jgi:hypothetical protein
MQSRSLSTADLTAARTAYEGGASYRDLGQRYGVAHDTICRLLKAVGVVSRPAGWPQRPRSAPPAEQPPARPAVAITSDSTGRLRIPWRTAAERRLRAWTAAELQALAVELAQCTISAAMEGLAGMAGSR